MPLVTLLVYILIMAIIWWLISTYLLPLLPQPFRIIVTIILVVIAILILLGFIGVIPPALVVK